MVTPPKLVLLKGLHGELPAAGDHDIARLQRGDVYDVIVLGVVDRQLQQGLPALLLGRG